ncbi:nck-associated protein 5 [Rhynchocyon petersi]
MEGKRQLEKRDFAKRLSLDSSLVEYMDSNKYLEHLLTQLQEQHRNLWREKLAVARLQREVAQRRSEGAMHEKLIHELEEERHLRLQSEQRLQEVTLESERNRIQMRGLQQQFTRMEETVQSLLQSQGSPEQKKEECVHIMVHQEKLSEEERKHKDNLEDHHVMVDEDLRTGSSSADEGKEKTKLLLERLKTLEAENSALALENENQREQYERCLDEVANQVVQALLTQKDLREECVKLKTRVFDLEQQNRMLSVLFQQRVRPASDLFFQEYQLNGKSGTPTLKCPGLGVTVPNHLCPANSCSSSELSLTSTCSEYSSGSSYTWHDGKTPSKRSSQNWDSRLSVGSSLPSGFAGAAEELPPTRIKESHILEGLRKLQKRKVLLETPSVITKWGYKDCMDSNEGIYSPGIKCSSLKACPPCKAADTGSPCKERHKAFAYDTDSHDDADEDSPAGALLHTLPHQGCRLHGSKLTQSTSDSLFGWELSGKHFLEGTASVLPRERPEKLSNCASCCSSEGKLCPRVQIPLLERTGDGRREGCLTLSLQLSDTDDNETLDELHIGSSDEKSPSDLSLTADTDKSMENLDILLGLGKPQLGSPNETEKPVSIQLENKPKTFSFIKQQRVVKRTSSEECTTVIFDAEDGEPIEFSSHQAGAHTVTGNEISINQASTGPMAKHTGLLPQGIAHLQMGADHFTPSPHSSKMPRRKAQCSKSPITGSQLLPRPLIEPSDHGETPTRDGQHDSGPEAGGKSPPPPPGRSLSLLIRPSYEYLSPLSPNKPETRVPSESAKTVFKSHPLKGSSTPVPPSNHAMTDVQGKKPTAAFPKPVFPHALPPSETVTQTRCSGHSPSSSFTVTAPAPVRVSPKRGIPRTSPQQTLGTLQIDTGFGTPKNCPSTQEVLETLPSKCESPVKKGQPMHSVPTPATSSFLGASESSSSQVSPSSSSTPCRSHSALHGCLIVHEKGLKTRLPVGLKALLKSPQLLRKSSTVPGKHEKDSLNEASKSTVASSKTQQEDGNPATMETAEGRQKGTAPCLQSKDSLAEGCSLGATLPESLEICLPGADGKDGMEIKSVKRSLSASKPHLKPALGMNGAKARSQSFSTHSGEKPSTPPMEGTSKVRTQIITNTAERGSSLTWQNSFLEGVPSKPPFAPAPESFPQAGRPLGPSSSRQNSLGSTGSSGSQHGSSHKLPLKVPPEPEEFLNSPGTEDHRLYTQNGCPTVTVPNELSNNPCRCLTTPTDCTPILQSPGQVPYPSTFESGIPPQLETLGRHPDVSITRLDDVSPEAPLSPTIEEKVMLCIQENMEKGQVQTKPTSVEAKQKPGPSFANWFGFRKSKLPALSSRKMDVSKTKVEKKDAKGLGFGNKQLKSERKKEKKKPELQCEIENELNRETESADSPDGSLQNRHLKTPQDIYSQMKLEPRNKPSPATCSTKDTFMTELLNRVDKKGAQQTEGGSNNVSCKGVLKGSSQGPSLHGSSVSTQGNHKKNVKTKADVDTPKDALTKEAKENLQEDEETTIADSTFQNHIIESSCQMRTLDSGIGTFPLPDSGNRSTGRYLCKPDSPEDTEPAPSLQPALSAASSIRAHTLDQEVPSSTDSQGSVGITTVHPTSDPSMTARGVRPPQSRLPKLASSGKLNPHKNDVEPRPQTHSSCEYAETSAPKPDWEGDSAAETQKLKQVEEVKEDPENRLSKISLESFKFNSSALILLEKENSLYKVEGHREEKGKNEAAPLNSSHRPGVDNMESLSDSLFDSFSSCASQDSNDL